ncbi:MAG: hypothetical protein HRF42_08260 [Candidatus Brocadia sp.]|jgi:hypothetical protein
MVKMKKDDVLTLKIRELKEKTRKEVQEGLFRESEEYRKQGIYPWEGIWLRPQDIRKVQERIKKRDKIVFGEIVLLFFVCIILSYVLYRLMKVFLLP